MTPCVVADTTVVGPVAMPTSEAPGPAVLKNTRSPAWMAPLGTALPVPNWAKLVRGMAMPAWRIAQLVRPEQSKLRGPVPPEAYGAPTFDIAAATAAWTPAPGAAGAGSVAGAAGAVRGLAVTVRLVSPSAPSVCGPTTPSTVRPFARWKARTAARVCGPKMPSAEM